MLAIPTKIKQFVTVALVAVLSLVSSSTLVAEEFEALIRAIEDVVSAEKSVYGLRDNSGTGMDCLQVFQTTPDRDAGVFYGVYHARRDKDFVVHLARSSDLTRWQHITSLDTHGSQPAIWTLGNGGYLLAYEKDAPNSCWIRLRHYKDLAQLRAGKHADEFDLTRSLAPTAEGTPSFDAVTLGARGLQTSRIDLRFHFFKNAHVDQLAQGALLNFKTWSPKPLEKANATFIRQGWRGNLGDREMLKYRGRPYYLQEIQRRRGDWASWRVCLCDENSIPLRTLSIRTHGNSTAFANPSSTWVRDSSGQQKLVVTLFLPSEGNPPDEVGTLLYVIPPSMLDFSHTR